jgi:hypothetical protein
MYAVIAFSVLFYAGAYVGINYVIRGGQEYEILSVEEKEKEKDIEQQPT